jgi:hypothetical protein
LSISTFFFITIPLNIIVVASFLYRTLKPEIVEDFCGDSYQCKFDYSMTMNKEYGHWTKYYQSQYLAMKENGLKPSMNLFL